MKDAVNPCFHLRSNNYVLIRATLSIMSPTRILIIEDDKDIVELVRYNLAHEGFQVSSMGDGGSGSRK